MELLVVRGTWSTLGTMGWPNMNWSPAARAVGAVSRALSVRSVATVHEFGPEAGEAGRLSTHLLLFDALGCIHAACSWAIGLRTRAGAGVQVGTIPVMTSVLQGALKRTVLLSFR